jgi:hypothetical protein
MKNILTTVVGAAVAIVLVGIFLEAAGKGAFGNGLKGIAGNITRGYGAPNA